MVRRASFESAYRCKCSVRSPVGHGAGAGALRGAESGDERRAHRRHGQREVEVAVGQVAQEARDRLVVDRHRVECLLQRPEEREKRITRAFKSKQKTSIIKL